MERSLNLLLSSLLALSAACSDTVPVADPWSVTETPNAMANGSSNGEANNVTANNVSPGECAAPEVVVFEQRGPEIEGLMVHNDRVFLTGVDDESPQPGVLEWSEAGIERRTSLESDIRLAGVSDRYLWLSKNNVLARLDLSTDVEELLDVPMSVSFGTFAYFAQHRQNAFGERFAWAQEGKTWLFDGTEAVELWSGTGVAPWVDESGVTYVGVDSGETFLAAYPTNGEPWRIFTEYIATTFPVLAQGQVFFLDRADVKAADLTDAVVQDIRLEGDCGPLYSDGHTVVTGCNPVERPEGVSSEYLTMMATQIWTFDAATGEQTMVRDSGDRSVFAPVLNEHWIAWVEYEPLVDNPDAPLGTVMAMSRSGGGEPFALGQMGQGCPFCGAYWPPPQIALGGDTLVWNYAMSTSSASPEVGPRNTYGVARLCP